MDTERPSKLDAFLYPWEDWKWHAWFAWHPVKVNGRWVWWAHIERRVYRYGGDGGDVPLYKYRLPEGT